MRICDKCIHDKVCLLSKSRASCELFDEYRLHGEWIDEGVMADGHPQHAFKCSECENHEVCIPSDIPYYHFCSNCGADMRKEGE